MIYLQLAAECLVRINKMMRSFYVMKLHKVLAFCILSRLRSLGFFTMTTSLNINIWECIMWKKPSSVNQQESVVLMLLCTSTFFEGTILYKRNKKISPMHSLPTHKQTAFTVLEVLFHLHAHDIRN
jgi:hypothetical protein